MRVRADHLPQNRNDSSVGIDANLLTGPNDSGCRTHVDHGGNPIFAH